MFPIYFKRFSITAFALLVSTFFAFAQNSFKLKYDNSAVYAGIEVGAKGVKMSVLEIGKNCAKNRRF